MQMNETDLSHLNATFSELATRLIESVDTAYRQQDPDNAPDLLVEAMHKVFELLGLYQEQPSQESRATPAQQDIHTLGDYAFNLLADLSSIAGTNGLDDLSRELEDLSFPLALWIARHGGKLSTLEPIINAISHQANAIREPITLEQLYQLTGEIQAAVATSFKQDLEKSNPGRPWRILLLNRAIIATRSHRPELIERAYDSLLQELPEEAPGFFQEGMQQMVALNYPQPVRKVVEKYYNLWGVERTLH
ncbi:MAG: hypothetical protein QNJ78_03790 [Gammaproteobacteria bacterium]|nr:hypothetical protein [Gammaproteobacteria bacterium]